MTEELEIIVSQSGNRAELIKSLENYINSNFEKKKKELNILWIQEWLDLFPKGVKSGGKLIRSDLKGCTKKMNSLIRENPQYTKEEIFQATKEYLQERSIDNYSYCLCATYFINKEGRGSELLSRLESLEEPKQYFDKRQPSDFI